MVTLNSTDVLSDKLRHILHSCGMLGLSKLSILSSGSYELINVTFTNNTAWNGRSNWMMTDTIPRMTFTRCRFINNDPDMYIMSFDNNNPIAHVFAETIFEGDGRLIDFGTALTSGNAVFSSCIFRNLKSTSTFGLIRIGAGFGHF